MDSTPGEGLDSSTGGTPSPDVDLIARLRTGEEAAFVVLVRRYQASLIRLAMLYVPDRASAEDVVQETWLGVFQGIERFEGRSALKTWLYRILVNRAMRRGERERRSIPFSAAWTPSADDAEAAVDPDRFVGSGRETGHWTSFPSNWDDLPEERVLSSETRARVAQAIAALPPQQREVITLRDIEGWGAEDVCNVLNLSETNQRVLLHRARSRVRRALEAYLGP